MVAQQLMQSDLLQCLTQATITILFFWSVKDIQGVPTGNLSSKVNSFCSNHLLMVEWTVDLAW